MEIIGHYESTVNGQQQAARTSDGFNPATGRSMKKVAIASKETVKNPITVAQAAYPECENTPPFKPGSRSCLL